jgi:predicted O-methyltransferase YrrM
MSPVNVVHEKQWLPGFARDLGHALRNPYHAWHSLRHWALLARYTGLPYAQLVRYRRELLDDSEFQAHLKRCRAEVPYVFAGLAELYAVVRAAKPGVIVETGVASGLSSAHILRALAANQRGMLHSIDLPNVQHGSVLPQGRTTGWMVPDSLRGRWKLNIGDSRKLLPEVLQALGGIDLFLHDSDHSYEYMSFEFELAFPRLKAGGLFLSDDTHLHTAWDDFCTKQGLRPTRIAHLGVTRRPKARTSSSMRPA